jgi:hypothetical protein
MLEFDPQLNAVIGYREFALRHRAADHRLFSLEALAELASSLPPAAVEYRQDERATNIFRQDNDFSRFVFRIVRDIKHEPCWVILKNIEQVSEYGNFLDGIMDVVEQRLPKREGRLVRREGFIIIVSIPRAPIPAHFEPEHNFFLQLRGRQEVHVGRFSDRDSKNGELARFYDNHYGNLTAFPPESSAFPLNTGDGYYNYPWGPHRLCSGAGVSISLSIMFRTRRSERFERACFFNHHLSRLGLSARPAGESELVDRGKANMLAALGWIRRRGRPRRGDYDFS